MKEFFSFQEKLNDKDKQIAQLQTELARMKEERDAWQIRANNSRALTMNKTTGDGDLIVVSRHKLKSILSKLSDAKELGLLLYVFQKIVPDCTSAEERKAITELFPEPSSMQPVITAEGDLKVEGNWNDIHDNHEVNI